MPIYYRCTNRDCENYNRLFEVDERGYYLCSLCNRALEELEEPTSGRGALAGMIFGGTIGLIGGPIGVIIGGVIGALLGDQVERENKRQQSQKKATY